MEKEITQELLFAYGRAIAQGKKYRDTLLRDYQALDSYTGKFLRSQILHACTDYSIIRQLRTIPYVKIKEEQNGRNYSFLQIETDNFYMTTSYVRRFTMVPRHAHFRCVRAMSNQPFLFHELEEQRPKGKPYLILIHGLVEKKREGEVIYEELFGGIGMPCGDAPIHWNEFLPLTDYIDFASNIPEETVYELDPGFLKLKKNFMGDDDNNDSA